MKKSMTLVACAVFALGTMVSVAQNDTKAPAKKEDAKMAPAKKEDAKKADAPKADAKKADAPKADAKKAEPKAEKK